MNNFDFEKIKKFQKKAPVRIIELCREFGVEVYQAVNWPFNSISGKIVQGSENDDCPPGSSGYLIIVNEKHTIERKRFTIAHELSHFLLHKDKIGDGIQDNGLYRSGLPEKIEFEANKMAAQLLMPWNLIHKALEDGNLTVKDLAKALLVSESAMAIRLGIPG